MLTLRAHHNKKRDEGLPALEGEALKPNSAKHTLQFIEDEYVEKDDDASHYTWGGILTATRLPKTTIDNRWWEAYNCNVTGHFYGGKHP